MSRPDFLYNGFLSRMSFAPTASQSVFFRKTADFLCSDEDILVLNGYAGTGKTTVLSAVIDTLSSLEIPCVLMAPTGRAAKVLSSYSGRQAFTIHKSIYRQKSYEGEFVLGPNKDRNTLYIVDEASLIGVDSQSSSNTSFGSGNLLSDLVEYVRKGVDCKLILCGDAAQLPPVGLECSPALNRDFMRMLGATVFVSLTEVVRQQHESGILFNATNLRGLIAQMSNMDESGFDYTSSDGTVSPDEIGLCADDFPDIERVSGGELIEKMSEAYSRYGEDETIVLCRSNKRAIRYNAGIRSTVQFKEERLVRDDKLMIVKNCYQFVKDVEGLDFIANGDIAKLIKIDRFEDRYGLHFARARLSLPDYADQEIIAKVVLDTLESESASLTAQQQNDLFQGVWEDYSDKGSKKKIYEAVREDEFYNALQIKYANAITCHKSQGGQWRCVFVDNPFWQDELVLDDIKWLYTAITRGVEKVYLVNFKDENFI